MHTSAISLKKITFSIALQVGVFYERFSSSLFQFLPIDAKTGHEIANSFSEGQNA